MQLSSVTLGSSSLHGGMPPELLLELELLVDPELVLLLELELLELLELELLELVVPPPPPLPVDAVVLPPLPASFLLRSGPGQPARTVPAEAASAEVRTRDESFMIVDPPCPWQRSARP